MIRAGEVTELIKTGHYAPIYNDYFLSQNAANIEGAAQINLTAVLIGNGWYDPLIQYEAFYNYTVSPGNSYNLSPYNDSVAAQLYNNMYGRGNCYDLTVECNTNGRNDVCAYADSFCYQTVEYIFDIVTERDEYDVRYLTPDPFPPTYYVDYLNTPEVQEAIGAYVNYSESNNAVSAAFANTGDDDRELGTTAAVKRIYDAGVTMVHYYGDADYVCNWIGGEVVAENVKATGFDTAGFANITTDDDVVHGQVKQAGSFAFVRIYESGHEVPFYKPLVSLELFRRVLNGLDIETGKMNVTAEYVTEGTVRSEFMEGNATVQTEVIEGDVVYDVDTALPVYENGTSADTGGGGAGSPPVRKRELEVDGGQKKKQRKRAPRWRPGKFANGGLMQRNALPVGGMRGL